MKITPKYVLTGVLIIVACALLIWIGMLGFDAGRAVAN